MRVLITREHAEPLAGELQRCGLEWAHVPLVSLVPSGVPVPDARPDAGLVTSAAAVRLAVGLPGFLEGARVVAVGPRTASALRGAGVNVAEVGIKGGVNALELLRIRPDERAWYVGAEEPSEALDRALRDQGVERWLVYRNLLPQHAGDGLRNAHYGCITFTSGSAVRRFVSLQGVPAVPVFAIGHSTAVVAQELGVEVRAVAAEPTMAALALVVAKYQSA